MTTQKQTPIEKKYHSKDLNIAYAEGKLQAQKDISEIIFNDYDEFMRLLKLSKQKIQALTHTPLIKENGKMINSRFNIQNKGEEKK